MSVQDTPTELWGGETTKAVANFPVSGERVPLPVVRWLGRIKGNAARVNAELGLLDQELADKIAAAGDEIAAGRHDAQFPIDVFQTGSGTSSRVTQAPRRCANIGLVDRPPPTHTSKPGPSSGWWTPTNEMSLTSWATSRLGEPEMAVLNLRGRLENSGLPM